MKLHISNIKFNSNMRQMVGATLLDVLIGIVIFVIGMMALAHLQGNLTRSSSDANMRTVAASIAEEIIEDSRNFEAIETTTGVKAYDDIADSTTTRNVGGVVYTVAVDVTSYLFDANAVDVSEVASTASSDFKHLDVTITWNTGTEFQIDEANQTGGTNTPARLGSGSFQITSVVPRILSLNDAKVAAEDDDELGHPPVDYTPGLRPEIVSIDLGNTKFKESSTPEPIVTRSGELMETWFDVTTYTSDGSDAVFLRREEFVTISCACTLKNSVGPTDGRMPTLWNGEEYDEGALVAKQYGVGASNQQSQYCDVCCNDHHDTGGGPASYRPTAGAFNGNHPHYGRNNQGVLTVAGNNDDYVEACRLVRKDGFFRVAQDFALQNIIAFPEDYLDSADEVAAYSSYVTTAVENYYGTPNPPASTWDNTLGFKGRTAADPTELLTTGPASQQFRSRGVYTDVISTALQNNLDNCFDSQGDPTLSDPNCNLSNAASPIEILPFFDVQLTQLARWVQTPTSDPVRVTNEEISNNGYSRGVGSLAGSKLGTSTSNSNIENGNIGLISIPPIRNTTAADYLDSDLHVSANGGTGPPPGGGTIISGSLTNAGGTGNDVASVQGTYATCTRPTNTTFSCELDTLPLGTPTIRISNYYKANQNLIACTSTPGFVYVTHVNGTSLDTNYTIYQLPTTANSTAVITIVKGTSCP